MKIRRYEIDYIFKKLNESKIYNNFQNDNCKFICIPRYNICINLRASSIHFFFTYVYKIRTYKTYLIWFFLIIVSLLPYLHKILNILKLKHHIRETLVYENINSKIIDLIYVEWHFFGIFSEKTGTVTHVLARESYEQRFLNELNARKVGEEFAELFPELNHASSDPKFYIEELAVDAGQQLITKEHFKRSQKKLIQINKKTLVPILLDNYYSKLVQKIGVLENENLLTAYSKIQNRIESTYLNTNTSINLALVHGDFNAGQILVKKNAIKIIDWGDGGVLNRFFDYISIAIYKSPDHRFRHKCFPKEFSALREFFRNKLKAKPNKELYVLITLLEILAVSKGEFESHEGAYLRWQTAAANNMP